MLSCFVGEFQRMNIALGNVESMFAHILVLDIELSNLTMNYTHDTIVLSPLRPKKTTATSSRHVLLLDKNSRRVWTRMGPLPCVISRDQ